MSSGSGCNAGGRDKHGRTIQHGGTVSTGDIVRWQGAIRNHIVEVIPGRKVAGPTMRDTPLARAGTVLEQLSADGIIGQDGKGLVHVLDGETAKVLDAETGEEQHTQSLHGHSTELWIQHIASGPGWDQLAPRYREVLR